VVEINRNDEIGKKKEEKEREIEKKKWREERGEE
jgi:hypothetical protein